MHRTPAVAEAVKAMSLCRSEHRGVNPDEVVAIGAVIEAVSAGDVKDVLLQRGCGSVAWHRDAGRDDEVNLKRKMTI